MDRKSIIGLFLIGIILIFFSIFNQPSDEEIKNFERQRDSIAKVNEQIPKTTLSSNQDTLNPAIGEVSNVIPVSDSATDNQVENDSGFFAGLTQGKEEFITIENELIKVVLTNKGGRVYSAQLKEYHTYDSLPLILFNGSENEFGLNFFAQNRIVSTNHLYFACKDEPVFVTGDQVKSISMVLSAGVNSFIEYKYTLKGNSFLFDLDVNIVGLNEAIAANANYLDLTWKTNILKQEKSMEAEHSNSTIYYKYQSDEETDYISERNDEQVNLSTKVQWVAFKQQFFSSALISEKGFDNGAVETTTDKSSANVVKNMTAKLTLPYAHQQQETYAMQFYFGPNHFQTLSDLGIGLEAVVPLGWSLLRWVNQFAIIPIFNFLAKFNLNYAIIIFILTLVIKIVLFPFTYKQYISMAKMKVIQPEMQEIQKKYKGDATKLQSEIMKLYRKSGVNPMGGCLPMLLQFPILVAMFYFFPSSIELRQQGFLWVTDLSSYDSIYDLGFNLPFYGDHISLFTILMTITTFIYTKLNNQMSMATNPQMKWMMYLMPIMFLGIFNNLSAALTYYYFLTNVITIGQQYLIKYFIDEKAIHAKIEEQKNKPLKKSRFQERLEAMARSRGYSLKK